MTFGHVFNQIKDQQLLGPARRIKDNSKQNPNKYCHYHEGTGHNTSECRDLMRQLWRLYEYNLLDEFISDLSKMIASSKERHLAKMRPVE